MNTPVYLDNQATTPVDPRVVEAMRPVFEVQFGNPSSATHRHGWFAQELVAIAREQVAALIGAEPEEVIFTSGATESNNLALQGTVRALMKRNGGSAALISATTEHLAVLDPLALLKEQGCKVALLNPEADGRISPASLQAQLWDETALASFMLGNNEIGVINDVRALAEVCRRQGVLLHCDASQAAGKIAIDVKQLGVDLLSLSAHKMYGPKGVGALYVRGGAPEIPLEPLMVGGGQERGLRSGTLNSPAIVGFGAASEIAARERAADAERLSREAKRLFQSLRSALGSAVRLNGSAEHRLPGSLNLLFDGVDNAALLGKLSARVSLSSTSACSSGSGKGSHVLAALGLSEAQQRCCIRIGIGRFNTADEVTFAAESIISAVSEISGGRSSC